MLNIQHLRNNEPIEHPWDWTLLITFGEIAAEEQGKAKKECLQCKYPHIVQNEVNLTISYPDKDYQLHIKPGDVIHIWYDR